MKFEDEIIDNFTARIPIINVVSHEENRIIRGLESLTRDNKWPKECGLYTWDIADQFHCHVESVEKFDCKTNATPDTILSIIEQYKGSAVFVLKDFHLIWEIKKSAIRKLRNLTYSLSRHKKWKNIVIITPSYKLPEELKEEVTVLYCPKPVSGEIDELLERVAGNTGTLLDIRDSLRDKIVETTLGLSETQAEKVFRKAIISSHGGKLTEACIGIITQEKREIIRESGALEFYPHTESETNVGGLEVLKMWLKKRERAFSDEAKNYGLDIPRGLALIGIPGTGKSLCAKLTAGLWKMPLLRLDMGAVFSGTLGSSERNIREAVQISEVIAPCILWVDEIEKALSVSTGDSGTSSRVLGTFLTWLQEKQKPVVIFATANDVRQLPVAFLRKQRFDEVFFLDLPTREERKQIFAVHLRKKGYSMIDERFDLEKLSDVSLGYVGAEIEAVVKDAMFPAFMDNERELKTDDLLLSIADMVPMAKSHSEEIDTLRKWVKEGKARNASLIESKDEVKVDTIRNRRSTRMMDV